MMMGAYEIRVITNGLTAEGAIIELTPRDGASIKLAPKSIRFEADGDGISSLSLTFFGCECRIIHTPYPVKSDAEAPAMPKPGEPA